MHKLERLVVGAAAAALGMGAVRQRPVAGQLGLQAHEDAHPEHHQPERRGTVWLGAAEEQARDDPV